MFAGGALICFFIRFCTSVGVPLPALGGGHSELLAEFCCKVGAFPESAGGGDFLNGLLVFNDQGVSVVQPDVVDVVFEAQIDCIEHAGLLTLSGETVRPEERETGSESGENTEPPTTRPDEQPGTETTGPSGASTTDAGTAPAASGCASAVGMTGFGLLMLPAVLPVLFRRKKKD